MHFRFLGFKNVKINVFGDKKKCGAFLQIEVQVFTKGPGDLKKNI